MATLPIIPPPNHVIVGADADARPDLPLGTAEKRFYDWMLAIQRGVIGFGVTDGGDAPPGVIGEIIESNLVSSSAVTLTSGVVRNVTSIALTAGDWRVLWAGKFWPTAGTAITSAVFGISTVSAVIQSAPESRRVVMPTPDAGMVGAGGTGIASANTVTRLSLAATTTVFAVTQSAFSAGTMQAFGHLWAERRR